eukprot:453096_1
MSDPLYTYRCKQIADIRAGNAQIIRGKPSKPTYNKSLFVPSALPISDSYDIYHISDESIKQKQLSDAHLYPIIEYLRNNNRYLLQDLPKYLYRYVLNGRYYLNENDILCYHYNNKRCVVVPDALHYSVLRWAHGNVHHGEDRILNQLAERFWWPKMREEVHKMVSTCHVCQSAKKGRNIPLHSGRIQTFAANKPFELISIDICGPLPQTATNNRYIVSMIDKYSRFCLLVPVPDIKTITVINAYERWISLFGPPKAVLSDNGSQFVSYYPETNGQVERLHRWIKERLKIISIELGMNFIDNENDNWDDYIPLIQHTYNATPNSTINYSPNKIIFGKDLSIALDRINDVQSSKLSVREYMRKMDNNRAIINASALRNQQRYDARRSKHYNKDRKDAIEYEIGDYVML